MREDDEGPQNQKGHWQIHTRINDPLPRTRTHVRSGLSREGQTQTTTNAKKTAHPLGKCSVLTRSAPALSLAIVMLGRLIGCGGIQRQSCAGRVCAIHKAQARVDLVVTREGIIHPRQLLDVDAVNSLRDMRVCWP